MYCAAVYFGITRASGADHFIPSYRDKNLEKRGIYKYIPNVMYTVVLLALIGVLHRLLKCGLRNTQSLGGNADPTRIQGRQSDFQPHTCFAKQIFFRHAAIVQPD